MNEPRPVGQTRAVGFQIGVRRTLPIPLEHAWELVTSSDGMLAWLGTPPPDLVLGARYQLTDGTTGAVRVLVPGSHLRLTWQPVGWTTPTTIQVRVIDSGGQSVIAFHQEQLPGPAERAARRAHFAAALDALKRLAAAAVEPAASTKAQRNP